MGLISYLIRLYKLIDRNKNHLLYIPLAVYWIALFIGTSLPAEVVPKVFSINDKLEHFAAFLILAVLVNLWLHFQTKNGLFSKNSFQFTAIIMIAYGALDEFHQILIPGRSCEFLDWLADCVGALFGIGIVYLFVKFTGRLKTVELN